MKIQPLAANGFHADVIVEIGLPAESFEDGRHAADQLALGVRPVVVGDGFRLVVMRRRPCAKGETVADKQDGLGLDRYRE